MEENGTLNLDRIKKYSSDTTKIASAIEALLKSDGWQIFLALFEKEKRNIKNKSDYNSLEEFKADRKALEIFNTILDVFGDYREDAKSASELLNKTIEAESQTADKNPLILGGEGEREGN